MSSIFFFVVILFLVLRATFSLPISVEVKTVQLPSSENQLTEKIPVIDTKTILNLEGEIKHVQGLSTETVLNDIEGAEADHGKRIKRQVISSLYHCTNDTVDIGGLCLPKEKLKESDEEVSDDSDAFEAKR